MAKKVGTEIELVLAEIKAASAASLATYKASWPKDHEATPEQLAVIVGEVVKQEQNALVSAVTADTVAGL